MITRREAVDQADRCFQYHVGTYILGVAALAAVGGHTKSLSWFASTWGFVVLAHGALLYANAATREQILMRTAAVMEQRRHALHECKLSATE
jgi:hypothetical protein